MGHFKTMLDPGSRTPPIIVTTPTLSDVRTVSHSCDFFFLSFFLSEYLHHHLIILCHGNVADCTLLHNHSFERKLPSLLYQTRGGSLIM